MELHVDDYHGSFKDTIWLQSFPLTKDTVLHYFALSPFYDKNCNNERLKMQRLEMDRLKSMRGIEYEVLPNPNQGVTSLFLIRKQRRTGINMVKALGIYYVLDGTVYQAPNIHAMLTSRLKKCSHLLHESFEGLVNAVHYEPTGGYAWDFSTQDTPQKRIPSEQLKHMLQRKNIQEQEMVQTGSRIDSILVGLLKKYIPSVMEGVQKEQIDIKTEPATKKTKQT